MVGSFDHFNDIFYAEIFFENLPLFGKGMNMSLVGKGMNMSLVSAF